MSRRLLKQVTVLGLGIASIAVIAWGIVAMYQVPADRKLALERSAAELKPILDEFRQPNGWEVYQSFQDALGLSNHFSRITNDA